MALGFLGRRGPLRELDLEPATGDAVVATLEQALTAPEPSVRKRRVADDAVLAGEIDGDVGGRLSRPLAAILAKGLGPHLDRALLVPAPEECLAEPIECFSARVILHDLLEQAASGLPVRASERCPRIVEA